MLMGQTQRLRTAANQMDKALRGKYDAINPSTIPPLLRDAADTIEDLRKTLRRKDDALMALQREYNDQIARIRNQRKQLSEMQAALERKTCHMVTDHDAFDVWLECDECGCILPNPCSMPKIHYCPSCGRRVVE